MRRILNNLKLGLVITLGFFSALLMLTACDTNTNQKNEKEFWVNDFTVEFDGLAHEITVNSIQDGEFTILYTGTDCDYSSSDAPILPGEYLCEVIYPENNDYTKTIRKATLIIEMKFSLNELGDTVTGYIGNRTELLIPDSYKDTRITKIAAKAFIFNTELKSIDLSGINEIGLMAFYGCNNLEYIFMPGDLVLSQTGYLPASVKKITVNDIADEIIAQAFQGFDSIEEIVFSDKISYIGKDAFKGCDALTELKLWGNTRISDTQLPVNLKTIKYYDGVEKVNEKINKVNSVESIIFPDTVTSVYENIYSDCNKLKTIFVTETRVSNLGYAIPSHGIEIIIQEGTTRIVDRAFANLRNIVSLTIPFSVESIGSNIFEGMELETLIVPGELNLQNNLVQSFIKKIKILDGSKAIGDSVFDGASRIEEMSIPESVETIGRFAFNACISIEQLILPSNLKKIGSRAFANCDNLMVADIPASVTEIGVKLFDNSPKISEPFKYNNNFIFEEDAIYNSDKTILVDYLKTDATHIIIDSNVKHVSRGVFHAVELLESITFSANILSIGDYQFAFTFTLKEIIILSENPLQIEEHSMSFPKLPVGTPEYEPVVIKVKNIEKYLESEYWSVLAEYLVEI